MDPQDHLQHHQAISVSQAPPTDLLSLQAQQFFANTVDSFAQFPASSVPPVHPAHFQTNLDPTVQATVVSQSNYFYPNIPVTGGQGVNFPQPIAANVFQYAGGGQPSVAAPPESLPIQIEQVANAQVSRPGSQMQTQTQLQSQTQRPLQPQSQPHLPSQLQSQLPSQPPSQPQLQPSQAQDRSRAQIQTEPPQTRNDTIAGLHTKFDTRLKLVQDPPNLPQWRQALFDLDDVLFMTEEDFQVYFPHVDNVYSHRSTQTYKLKPFVSHYWDCRLKGRPPGTPKSTDPEKKKRKRVARERDLCDVKIKITEYKRGEVPLELKERLKAQQHQRQSPLETLNTNTLLPSLQQQPIWPSTSADQVPLSQITNDPNQKWFTVQRVNGNGANGKTEGIPGPHKHDIQDSDRVKKNSVLRHFVKPEPKPTKKGPIQKTYAKKATGQALATVKEHLNEHEFKLYGACFCPFVHRVWISLEQKRLPYQYIEVDPYKKPQSLLEVSPKGLVPAIRHGPTWSCHDSQIIMEYLEDLSPSTSLFPSNPQQKATSRLWAMHVNNRIIPGFYRLLQEQDNAKQVTHATDLKDDIQKLIDAADPIGPFFGGANMSFVDVMLAPWMLRLSRVMKPYRGWPDAEPQSRWGKWIAAVESDENVKATTSSDDLYLDSYERYAENRPNTSQVADAINSGRGLP